MMFKRTSDAIDAIEADFTYDVTESTVAFFYLLQGMEVVSFNSEHDSAKERGDMLTGPGLMHLRVWPAVSTIGPDMVGTNGLAVQMAFKGWMADIFAKWERLRSETLKLVGDTGIPPEVDCMGDLRLIRNDLIHTGHATKDHSEKCKTLKWFKPEEPIILTTDHVFDFLNQMNLLTPSIALTDGAELKILSWSLSPSAVKPTSLRDEQIRIVSVRVAVDQDGERESQRYMMSSVFSDGIYGQGPVEAPVEPEEYLQWYIDEDGNIAFPSGPVIDAQELYDNCFDYVRGIRREGPGILGPPARYTNDGDG